MKTLRAYAARIAAMFSRGRGDRDLTEELESHLQLHVDDNIKAGMTPAEAYRHAVIKLGGVEPAKEAMRDRRTLPMLDNLGRDIRFAARQLRKNPAFTGTAIVVLTLGMGAALAIFAFVDAALLKPLPYPNPRQLLHVTESVPMIPRANLSYFDYLDWKSMNKVLHSLEVYKGSGFLLTTPSGPVPVPTARVSAGFFRELGVHPLLGRDFYDGEDLPGATHTVILSYATWQKRFGGRQDIVNQPLRLEGLTYTVIAVLPKEFQFAPLGRAELWATIDPAGGCEKRRSCHNLEGIGRMKEGVSLQSARADMTSLAQRLEKQYPDSNRSQGASVEPLDEVIVGRIRPILLMLMGGAGLLLLVAAVNVASLLLVRSESRRREIAVRGALGASAARLFRQFLTEGVLLVGTAIVFGLLLSSWAMRLLLALIPANMMSGMPFLLGLGVNGRLLLCAGMLALLTTLLFSLTPAVHVSFSRMRDGLAEGGRGTAGTTWRRLGANLVVLELATAMVLLVGAGLLGKSLYRLLTVDVGFVPDRLATLVIAAPDNTYGKDEQAIALSRQILTRVSNLPGVTAVGTTNILPVSFNGNTDWIRFVGKPYNGEHNEVNGREVSAGYFAAVGARLLQGRYFTDSEDQSKPRVILINKTLASKYFPGENPIGQRIGNTALTPDSIAEVVGVVDDVRDGALDAPIWPAVYRAFNQSPGNYFSLVVRTSQDPGASLPGLVAAVHDLHPDIAISDAIPMLDRMKESQTAYLHRSAAWLVGSFAGLALLLGVIGLYGVVAYSVSRRTREIGVRMALGAQQNSVYRLILREAGWLVGLGVGMGMVLSVGAATVARNLLFGVSSWDFGTLGAVALLLASSALVASYVPARRAAAVNPVDALRAE